MQVTWTNNQPQVVAQAQHWKKDIPALAVEW
jgi:hypothetical protein